MTSRRWFRGFCHTTVDKLTHSRFPECRRTSRSKFGISPCPAVHSKTLQHSRHTCVPRTPRPCSTWKQALPRTSEDEYPNNRPAALFQERISPCSLTVKAASVVPSRKANNSLSSIPKPPKCALPVTSTNGLLEEISPQYKYTIK